MHDHSHTGADAARARDGANLPADAEDQRELLVMRSGAHAFAVFADEADSVTRGVRPTPLPHAPRAVLGVVAVRGRIRTLLDPLALLGAASAPEDEARDESRREDLEREDGSGGGEPRFTVALRGDEQLALAVERVERIVAAPPDALEPAASPTGVARATFRHGERRVVVLDPALIFEAAMQGTDRRRHRQKQ
jgi:chemotaxis signal transduction protein